MNRRIRRTRIHTFKGLRNFCSGIADQICKCLYKTLVWLIWTYKCWDVASILIRRWLRTTIRKMLQIQHYSIFYFWVLYKSSFHVYIVEHEYRRVIVFHSEILKRLVVLWFKAGYSSSSSSSFSVTKSTISPPLSFQKEERSAIEFGKPSEYWVNV